jgi:hypothetical protein
VVAHGKGFCPTLRKIRKAYLTRQAAERMTHEEIAGQPSTRRRINDLITNAPPRIKLCLIGAARCPAKLLFAQVEIEPYSARGIEFLA